MKRVLDIGQCGADHGAIRRLVEGNFEARVVQAHDAREALAELRAGQFDLVLVNRRLDLDGSDGLEIVKAIKGEEAIAATPVMLVTNYAEYQEAAVAAGAEPGFGKAQLHEPGTVKVLAVILGER
jgi:two-component system chemotaxis response regulator CheY